MTRATSPHVLYDPKQISDLIASIYDSTTDTSGWEVFAEKLGHALDLRAVNFLLSSREPGGRLGFVPVGWGVGKAELERYNAEFAHKDAYLRAYNELASGEIFINSDIIPDDEFVRGPLYKDVHLPLGLRYGFGGMIRNDGFFSSLLFCHRGPEQQPPSDEDVGVLGLLMPHLQRARALAVQFGNLNEGMRLAVDLCDRFRVGVLFLDRRGKVMHANERAHAIFAEDDGLALADKSLRTPESASSKALQSVIEAAAAITAGHPNDQPINIRLPRPSGRRPLDVSALPIGRRSRWWAEVRASVCLTVNDGETSLEGTATRLGELYELSVVEAELAVAIACGFTVRDWAEHRRVSIETVRWQLKQVFAKTGTSRQPELMRMVLQGPGMLR
jgi:DNA-binding CsgD family transcriptional regulator